MLALAFTSSLSRERQPVLGPAVASRPQLRLVAKNEQRHGGLVCRWQLDPRQHRPVRVWQRP